MSFKAASPYVTKKTSEVTCSINCVKMKSGIKVVTIWVPRSLVEEYFGRSVQPRDIFHIMWGSGDHSGLLYVQWVGPRITDESALPDGHTPCSKVNSTGVVKLYFTHEDQSIDPSKSVKLYRAMTQVPPELSGPNCVLFKLPKALCTSKIGKQYTKKPSTPPNTVVTVNTPVVGTPIGNAAQKRLATDNPFPVEDEATDRKVIPGSIASKRKRT